MLEAGQTTDHFTIPTDTGSFSSAGDAGGKTVIFFFPRADTSGCTKEAIAFTGLLPDFEAAGVTVLGISKDTVAKHDKFRDKHALGMPLLSDENSDTCEAYDVWKEKSMYGKKFFGIERSTFLIGADCKIAQVWRKVKVPGHAEAVLEATQAL